MLVFNIMSMRIATYLNTSKQEVFAKKLNIIIGVSLGNKYFTKEHILDYLLWSVENTKEKVTVLIPDKIHAVNYEVRSGYNNKRAEKKAQREGGKIKNIVEEIINGFSTEQKVMVNILKWEEIETENHKRMVAIFYDEFINNPKFKKDILDIVKEYFCSEKLANCDYEKLATYVLEELPMLVAGIEYEGIKYDLLPYPGISKIDYLKIGLQESTIYPELSKKLNITNKLRLIEAYAE